jgi:hypothetical protein
VKYRKQPFNLKFSDGRVCIYRRRRERFADGCVKETDQYRGGGGIGRGGPSLSNTCSMGFKSGDNAGQDRVRVRMCLSLTMFMATREIWHLALSCMRLIGSMCRRCLAVINARGGHTRYKPLCTLRSLTVKFELKCIVVGVNLDEPYNVTSRHTLM